MLCFLFKDVQQLKPTFIWLSERSPSGVPHLEIQPGLDKETIVAVLNPYNPIPANVDQSQSEIDPCIFLGHLANEPDSSVLVTGGCPGDDTFDVSYYKI